MVPPPVPAAPAAGRRPRAASRSATRPTRRPRASRCCARRGSRRRCPVRAPADRRHPARAGAAFLARRGAPRCRRAPSSSGCCPSPSSASCWRGRRVFVSAAAWEDFGIAPLEALDRGAVLVGAPGGGPFPALALARSLAPEFVAADRDAASLARRARGRVRRVRRTPARRLPRRRPEPRSSPTARRRSVARIATRCCLPCSASSGAPRRSSPRRTRRPRRRRSRDRSPGSRHPSGREVRDPMPGGVSAPAIPSTSQRIDQQRVAAVDRDVTGGAGGHRRRRSGGPPRPPRGPPRRTARRC